VAVFGIIKRKGKVYTAVVNDTKTQTLMPLEQISDSIESLICVSTVCFHRNSCPKTASHFSGIALISQKIKPDSIVYTDSYKFADGKNHINGIENFWSQAKRILRKYLRINRKSCPLFLKECEFRFNYATPRQKIKILRKWCKI